MNQYELEILRKRELVKFVVLLIMSIILFTAFVALLVGGNMQLLPFSEEQVFTYGILLFIPFVVTVAWQNHISKSFENLVKANYINEMIANIINVNGKIVWEERDKVVEMLGDQERATKAVLDVNDLAKEIFTNYLTRESKLFSQGESTEDDIFTGDYKGIKLRISETKITIRGSKNSRTTIFRGPLIALKADREFQGHTLIGKSMYKDTRYLQRLNLPMKEFAKRYDVYTDNVDGTSQILTPEFCDFLIRTKNVRLACYRDNVVVAYDARRDMFKLGNLFKSIDDQKQFMKFTQDFNMLLDIIDNLKTTLNI